MDLYLEVQREHALTGAPVALVVRRALRAHWSEKAESQAPFVRDMEELERLFARTVLLVLIQKVLSPKPTKVGPCE